MMETRSQNRKVIIQPTMLEGTSPASLLPPNNAGNIIEGIKNTSWPTKSCHNADIAFPVCKAKNESNVNIDGKRKITSNLFQFI